MTCLKKKLRNDQSFRIYSKLDIIKTYFTSFALSLVSVISSRKKTLRINKFSRLIFTYGLSLDLYIVPII